MDVIRNEAMGKSTIDKKRLAKVFSHEVTTEYSSVSHNEMAAETTPAPDGTSQ